MLLEKSDLKQIEKIVEKSAESTKKELRQEIQTSVSGAEKRIIAVINREVGDLAEINRAVIDKVSKIDDLEKRIIRIEHKVGITS